MNHQYNSIISRDKVKGPLILYYSVTSFPTPSVGENIYKMHITVNVCD